MKLPAAINKIIVFRALQLGDMLCHIPAMRALRRAYPGASITLAGLPWAKSFTDRFSAYFDDFIRFPGYPGLPEQPVDPVLFTSFLNNVQNVQFDLALQMQGNGTIVNAMIELFNARYTAGFFLPGDYTPNPDYFLAYPANGSEIERHLQLMEYLGIQFQGNQLEFPITKQDQQEYELLKLNLVSQKYICIHPGSRGAWRQWPTAHFAAVADYAVKCGFEVVITGTKDEATIAEEVIKQMQQPAINLAGLTSLGVMGILIKNACALIANCTGVSHMAAAFKTPSIVISMDGEPERWGPINKELHHMINWQKDANFEQVLNRTDNLLHEFYNT
ncbi:glycosyltransferase family 9 protein [Mucilaginibacter sp.]|uniref:glycosyltransferase family 9 protein n=1 Tax=Mucilaginibacter sp. TaxID=1882438 RepID=UPI00262EEACF|nr:glycosyltransferase family 9 protein [Mucilaginibacter sp.]MDB4926650.1 glycosyl transferase family 9 [Mucilaginibacter sp.]